MDDEGKTEKKLIKCEDLSDEERFALSDEAYKGTVIILFEIPEGWKWKIIHINKWDDSRFTGFEPLPLIRLFPEDAIALLRKGKVTPNFYAPPTKLPSSWMAPVPWDEWGGYFLKDFFPTTFLKLIKVNKSEKVSDPSANLELTLKQTFYQKPEKLNPAQQEWLEAKRYPPPPEPHERPQKIKSDLPIEVIKKIFEDFSKYGWVSNLSLDRIPEHFSNSTLPEQKVLGVSIIWTGGIQRLKALKRILDLKDEDIIDNFETVNKKGHKNLVRKTSLTGGSNPSDSNHYDEIREVIHRHT